MGNSDPRGIIVVGYVNPSVGISVLARDFTAKSTMDSVFHVTGSSDGYTVLWTKGP